MSGEQRRGDAAPAPRCGAVEGAEQLAYYCTSSGPVGQLAAGIAPLLWRSRLRGRLRLRRIDDPGEGVMPPGRDHDTHRRSRRLGFDRVRSPGGFASISQNASCLAFSSPARRQARRLPQLGGGPGASAHSSRRPHSVSPRLGAMAPGGRSYTSRRTMTYPARYVGGGFRRRRQAVSRHGGRCGPLAACALRNPDLGGGARRSTRVVGRGSSRSCAAPGSGERAGSRRSWRLSVTGRSREPGVRARKRLRAAETPRRYVLLGHTSIIVLGRLPVRAVWPRV